MAAAGWPRARFAALSVLLLLLSVFGQTSAVYEDQFGVEDWCGFFVLLCYVLTLVLQDC